MFIQELAARLDITPTQVLILSVFISKSDDKHLTFSDLTNHFDNNIISIFLMQKEIDDLVTRRVICRFQKMDDSAYYRVPQRTIDSLNHDKLIAPIDNSGPDTETFLDNIDRHLNALDDDEIDNTEFQMTINDLLENNTSLPIVQRIQDLNLCFPDLKLFLIMSMKYINDNDNCINYHDIRSYMENHELRIHTRRQECGEHNLMQMNLVENVCDQGKADPNQWCLTDHSKNDILGDVKVNPKKKDIANLKKHESITEKELFFNKKVTNQVDELSSLLNRDRMKRILDRLAKQGQRRGFACLFYGAPGTGKTETALQLARQTGRDIMMVDIPSIRSKWVGETEENIKNVFTQYRRVAKDNDIAPILFFNEADALLTTRNEDSQRSVDKMENAMQNIILQEMEDLEGIMIATTNLAVTLDPAFERRFLYKVEFDKPTPDERRHIWQSKIPELTEDDALKLAKHFDFSGGQIENIARKRIINDIIHERDELDIQDIWDSCENELLNKEVKKARMGFVA